MYAYQISRGYFSNNFLLDLQKCWPWPRTSLLILTRTYGLVGLLQISAPSLSQMKLQERKQNHVLAKGQDVTQFL